MSTVLYGCLVFLEDDVIDGAELLPDLLVSGRVKEEDEHAQEAVQDGEGAVQRRILLREKCTQKAKPESPQQICFDS